MSMLAEPRRKQKWSIDPRNSTWSNDESKFGQKMLERMGWSKGKGLGKSEQGATEHIKVRVKNNSLGLGTTTNHEDNWIAHQDDFNQLLAELNNCHGQNTTEELSQEETQGFSLEEKSKTSKKRVHYMKFTKGKDLSSRSETDLACIFGKRAKQMRNQYEESNGTESQEEKERDIDDQDGTASAEVELNTVTSTMTMQEYFAQRMAQLKKGRTENQSSASPSETNGISQPAAPKSAEDSSNTSDMEESKKRKKKKKRDRKNDQHRDEREVDENVDAPGTEQVTAVEQADSESKKKKKKKKRQSRVEDTVQEGCVPPSIQDTAGDTVAYSTEKKKKRKNKIITNEDDKVETLTDSEVLDEKRKKRKLRELEEEQIEVGGKKFKRDKKKRKNDN